MQSVSIYQVDTVYDEELLSLPDMAWTVPAFTKKQVDLAGATLIDSATPEDQLNNALAIINNWRSSHSFPLNTLQTNLRRNAKMMDQKCLIAQRIKRLSSIDLKLRRFPTMKLSQMQDIGGCRAIVKSVTHVNKLVNLYKKIGFKHKLDHIDDYIQQPKQSGYRGVHFIYRYYSDKKETYNGLKIEMQIRSPLQHAWATAVETVGTFIKQSLKSSMGEEDWLRFFMLMGTAIAFWERTPVIPNTPSDKKELISELHAYTDRLDVTTRLKAYGAALEMVKRPSVADAHYFLLNLVPADRKVIVYGFKANELDQATEKYLEIERNITTQLGAEAVLVSVESLESLRRAYPNYFLDTSVFINAVNRALEE